MPKQVIDREELIDEVYAIASHEGVFTLSVREIAAACGTTIGSVYVYFPTEAGLTAIVLKRFFTETFFEKHCTVREGEDFTSYLRRFHDALSEAVAVMSIGWFAQIRRLPDSERCALETARTPMMAHMERGLRHVLGTDDAVARARPVGAPHPESLCRFALHNIFASLMGGSDCEAFFALLDATLHTSAVLYADTALYADPAPSVGTTLYIDAETPLQRK